MRFETAIACCLLFGAGAAEGGRRVAGSARVRVPAPTIVASALDLSAAHARVVARGGTYRIESGPVSFGELTPGEPSEEPGAVRVRVFAEDDWALALAPASLLEAAGSDAMVVPHSRLAWRSQLSGGYVPFDGARPAIVARGAATGPAGALVVLDLRLTLESNDPLGRYGCTFQVRLDVP